MNVFSRYIFLLITLALLHACSSDSSSQSDTIAEANPVAYDASNQQNNTDNLESNDSINPDAESSNPDPNSNESVVSDTENTNPDPNSNISESENDPLCDPCFIVGVQPIFVLEPEGGNEDNGTPDNNNSPTIGKLANEYDAGGVDVLLVHRFGLFDVIDLIPVDTYKVSGSS